MDSRSHIDQRDYPCWAVVQPAPDLPGKWIAHCLEFDVLAQADDPNTAVQLVMESARQIVVDDLNEGLDPQDRRAPDEDWKILRCILDESLELEPQAVQRLIEQGQVMIASQFMLSFFRQKTNPALIPDEPLPIRPVRHRRVERASEPSYAQ